MDTPSGYRNVKSGGQRRPKGNVSRPTRQAPPQNPQLFDDTSSHHQTPVSQGYGYNQGQQNYATPQVPYGQQIFNDPMANMGVQYASTLADQGKDYVNKNLEKYVSTSKIKYYFAVDTAYVAKKLGLLFFPFSHTDWSVKYNQDEPVAPRYEINAPDLYIPLMAFVTYILTAGIVLGTQNRFTPEQLGIQASSATVWLVIEILVVLVTLYVMNIKTDFSYLDITAYCGYKYVGMISCLVAGLLVKGLGYYITLLYFSGSLAFFIIRSLKVQILPHSDSNAYNTGNKRRLYLLLFIAGIQPVFIWFLTHHIVFGGSNLK